eukprot:scaffold1292_cov71-Cyclotella_meneghiniana.AAC.2
MMTQCWHIKMRDKRAKETHEKATNNDNNAMMVMNYDTPSKQPFQNSVSSEDNVTINLECKRNNFTNM